MASRHIVTDGIGLMQDDTMASIYVVKKAMRKSMTATLNRLSEQELESQCKYAFPSGLHVLNGRSPGCVTRSLSITVLCKCQVYRMLPQYG